MGNAAEKVSMTSAEFLAWSTVAWLVTPTVLDWIVPDKAKSNRAVFGLGRRSTPTVVEVV